jgi:hypothetical protein
VVVPGGGDVPSNVVHTVTVVDALSRIAAGAPAGVYDLVSLPVWSWRQVLEEETRTLGTALAIEAPALDPFAAREGPLVAARAWTRRTASTLFAAPRMREAALSAIAHLPESVNLRLQSQHFRRRAGAEIGALRARRCPTRPSRCRRSCLGASPGSRRRSNCCAAGRERSARRRGRGSFPPRASGSSRARGTSRV